MADDSQSSSLQLTIRLTTHPVLPVPTNYPLSTTRTATVADLKQQLQREFDGKPLAEGIVCVKGGRVCKDTEVLGELFPAEVSSSLLWDFPNRSPKAGHPRAFGGGLSAQQLRVLTLHRNRPLLRTRCSTSLSNLARGRPRSRCQPRPRLLQWFQHRPQRLLSRPLPLPARLTIPRMPCLLHSRLRLLPPKASQTSHLPSLRHSPGLVLLLLLLLLLPLRRHHRP